MGKIRLTYITIIISLLFHLCTGGSEVYAQNALQKRLNTPKDSLKTQLLLPKDSLTADSLERRNQQELKLLEAPVDTASLVMKTDSIQKKMSQPKKRFVPDSNRSVWLAMVFPGAGQIYNRKYWKLPIVYGGFVGCTYALTWNNKMYKEYSQAYLDFMDDDPNTKSYEDFIPRSSSIVGQEERYKELFRKRKDAFRRQRDLSIFAFVGVYLLSIIDAYVDAELSDFDITKELSLKVEPTMFNDTKNQKINSEGLQCSLKF